MPNGDIETFYEEGKWHSRVEGEGEVLSSHDDKDTAVAYGRRVAGDRKVEHVVKKLDGTIGEINSYGNDPRDIPG